MVHAFCILRNLSLLQSLKIFSCGYWVVQHHFFQKLSFFFLFVCNSSVFCLHLYFTEVKFCHLHLLTTLWTQIGSGNTAAVEKRCLIVRNISKHIQPWHLVRALWMQNLWHHILCGLLAPWNFGKMEKSGVKIIEIGKFWRIYVSSLEKVMAPHSSTLAWKIPWVEEPSRLQSMGSLRLGHNWETSLSLFTFTHWRRKWQPTPVFLPGESQGRGSLVGCRLWGRTGLDTTEAT